ncbi:solute carrier family 7 member 13 isoform X2 [Ictidomys tridecemlineatus]
MDKEKKIQLKRNFGYFRGTSFLIINIIGAGIFVSPKGVLEYSCMNVGLSLCVWAICAVLSLTESLCYAEIGITFPYSGAHYYFLKRCFGPLIAFLRLWTSLFEGSGIIATQALLLAEYSIQPFFPSCLTPKLPKKCLALAMLWSVGILNSRGELKKPSKTIPKCIFTAIPLVTVLFLLVNISYLTVLTPREILSSDAVAITWTDRMIPQLTWIIPFAISASLYSNLLVNVLDSTRVTYIAGQQGQLPLLFNTLNIHSSPLISVLLIVALASTVIVLTNLIELINNLYFMISIWTVLTMMGILKLRYQEPNLHRPYKVFLPFTFITMAISLGLVLIPLVKSPKMHYIYVFLFLLSGLLFYIPLVYFKLKLVWFEKMTCYLQLLFNVCIPDVSDEETEVDTLKN